MRFVGEDGELEAAGVEGGEQLRDAVIDVGFDGPVVGVEGFVFRDERGDDFFAAGVFGEHAADEVDDAVADEVAELVERVGGEAVAAHELVAAPGDVGGGVHEGAVEVE